MSELVHFEYAPPRSWEQFEELCADLFERMWNDPGLMRHGRAGQAQFGVDIVASRGGIYPVGLQCKKKSRWPVKKLSVKEIDKEVEEARKFKPILKEFYILTTAEADAKLESHVRSLNESQKNKNEFTVVILFWPEIIRKVSLCEEVARKHFTSYSGRSEFSPLLASWYTKAGKIEVAEKDFLLSVREVGEDFQDWPTGRIVVRQRESDELMGKLLGMNRSSTAPKRRAARIEVRRNIRTMKEKEQRVQDIIKILFTNDTLKFYMLGLDRTGEDASKIIMTIIESELKQHLDGSVGQKIRVAPPTPNLLSGPRIQSSVSGDDIPIYVPSSEYEEILDAERNFSEKYHGNTIPKMVDELPPSVRTSFAIPAIIFRVMRIMSEDRKSISEMDMAGFLDLDSWSYVT